MEGVWKIGVFRPTTRYISKTVQNTAIVTMEDEQELDLSNGAWTTPKPDFKVTPIFDDE